MAEVCDEIEVSDPHDRTFTGWFVGLTGAPGFKFFSSLTSPFVIVGAGLAVPVEPVGGAAAAGDAIRNF